MDNRAARKAKRAQELLNQQVAANAKRQADFKAKRARILDRTGYGTALADRDDLRAIILAETYLDHLLMYLIDRHMFIPGEFYITDSGSDAERSYSLKVALATALGEIEYRERKLFAVIGNIRNNFAHSLDCSITEADTERVFERVKGTFMEGHAREWFDQMQKFVDETPGVGIDVHQAFIRCVFQKAYDFLYDKFEKPLTSPAEKWEVYKKNLTDTLTRHQQNADAEAGRPNSEDADPDL